MRAIIQNIKDSSCDNTIDIHYDNLMTVKIKSFKVPLLVVIYYWV
jgi:hypothetical protein